MAQPDGSIVIDTEIKTDGFREGAHEVEAAVKRMASTVKDIGTAAQTALNKQVDTFVKMNQAYSAQAQKVDELKKKVAEYGEQEIPTERYAKLSEEIQNLETQYGELVEKERQLSEMGFPQDTGATTALKNEMEELLSKIRKLETEQRNLRETGLAFTDGTQTKQAIADMEKLAVEERKLDAMQRSLNSSYTAIKVKVQEYGGELIKNAREVGILQSTLNGLKMAVHAPVSILQALGNAMKKLPGKTVAAGINLVKSALQRLGTAAKSALSTMLRFTGKSIVSGLKKLTSGILGIHKSVNKTTLSFGKMLRTSLLMGAAFRIVSALMSGMQAGIQNLAQYSGETNQSISMLVSSLETLKNSFASAFAPIINVVAPILSGFINMISRAVTYVGMFIAALTGKSTFTKAVAVQKDYAAILQDTSSSAENLADNTLDNAEATDEAAEAAEGYLSPLDEINKYSKESEKLSNPVSTGLKTPSTGNLGGGGSSGDAPLFEEVPILNSIKGLAQKIKDLIKSEDFEGLGAFLAGEVNKGLQKIKDVISWENVGPAITRFITAFTTTFNSFVDNLDWDLLGRTIGTGINTIINTFNLLITGIDWKNLGAKIAEGLNGLVAEVDFWNLGTLIGNKIMILPQMVLGFAERLDWSLIGNQIGVGLNAVVQTIDLSVIAETLGKVINGIFQGAIEFSKTFDWKQLGTNIYQGINTFFTTVDWAAVGKGISDFIKGLLDSLITAIEGVDWSQVAEAIKTTLVNIDWAGIAVRILELLGYALGAIVGVLAKLIGEAIGNAAAGAKQYFETKIEEAGGNVVLGILTGIKDAIVGIAKWVYENVFMPIIEGFKNAFGINSPSTVMQEQGHYIIEGLLSGITDFIGRIKDKFKEIKNLVVDKMTEVKDGVVRVATNMKDKLGQAVDAIKEKFSNVFNRLAGIIKTPINGIISIINALLRGIQTMQNAIASAMNNLNIELPGWLQSLTGFSSIGFNFGYWTAPQIPYLASGAVIPPNREFLAVLGDQKQGTNIEAPERLLRKIMREEISKARNGGSYTFVAQINRRTLFEEVMKEADFEKFRTDINPFAQY
jgi:phage-related protein